jgi:hypothetical protein
VQGEWLRGQWLLAARAGRVLDMTNDFRAPYDSGSTLGALVFSLDDYDYVDRGMVALSLARLIGGAGDRAGTLGAAGAGSGRPAALVRAEVGLGSDRWLATRVRRGLFVGDSGFRQNRGVDVGSYVRTAAALELHPDVNAEFMSPGMGATLRYERGDGELDWQRAEVRVVGRRNWRRVTYAARVDAGVLLSGSPPPQQLFELGQSQNLPGYGYKEFAGDRAAVVRLMGAYTLPYLGAPMRFGRRWALPSPSPALAAGVQSGWAEASDSAALASIARLGVRGDPNTGEPVLDPVTGAPVPVSRPTGGIRSSVELGVRLFGGSMFLGASRPIDHHAPWKFALTLAQQL